MKTVFYSSSCGTGEAPSSSSSSHNQPRYPSSEKTKNHGQLSINYTQTKVPAPWSEPMLTRPKVWINETATTTATQTDILIELTLDEPWVEHVHVLERPRSPADNRPTVYITHTIMCSTHCSSHKI